MKRAAVLFSGGLDSTYVCYKLLKMGYEVHPITFKKDNLTSDGVKSIYDANVANDAFDFLTVMDTGGLQLIKWEVYDPVYDKDGHTEHFRNVKFIAQAASYCVSKQINELYIGEYDNGPAGHMDASSRFLGYMREVLTMNPFKVKLRTLKSLRISSKWDVLYRLKRDDIINRFLVTVRWCYNRDETMHTFSFDNFIYGHWYGCGECKSCEVFIRQLNIAKACVY